MGLEKVTLLWRSFWRKRMGPRTSKVISILLSFGGSFCCKFLFLEALQRDLSTWILSRSILILARILWLSLFYIYFQRRQPKVKRHFSFYLRGSNFSELGSGKWHFNCSFFFLVLLNCILNFGFNLYN